MGQAPLDEGTKQEIETVTTKVLREAGIVSPPVQVAAIVNHVELYRDFYDLQDPSFLDRIKHKVRLHGRKLAEIIAKVNLAAVLLYDEDRIVLDRGLPPIKHDWATCHEVGHRILCWHKTYFRGDTVQTLDPRWQERLEAEANYAASEFMFCGSVFNGEARDVSPTWDDIKRLAKRYGKSLAATLRRFVEHGPDVAMAMLESTPAWTGKPEDQADRWRHFAASPRFVGRFSCIMPPVLLGYVDINCRRSRGGPVGFFEISLDDDNGEAHEFCAQSFFNQHYILSLFVETRKRPASRIIVPALHA